MNDVIGYPTTPVSAGVGLGGITVVVGLGAVVGALVRRRNDALVR